jgi:hypothetical protein
VVLNALRDVNCRKMICWGGGGRVEPYGTAKRGVLEKTAGWFCGKPWFNTVKTTRETRRMPYRQDIGSLGWGEKGGGQWRECDHLSETDEKEKAKREELEKDRY